MWYPVTVSEPVTEPVTDAQAMMQMRISNDEAADFAVEIAQRKKAARDHVERYTGLVLGSREMDLVCTSFMDFAQLPVSPVTAVSEISYVDADGADQTLSTDVYELIPDRPAYIVTKYNQSWPEIEPGSRITVTASVGAASVPASVIEAMLLLISEGFDDHGNRSETGWRAVDSLLCNHRTF